MSENVDSYVVIDARSGIVYTPSPPFNMVGAAALDLPSDLWRDFMYFVNQAEEQQNRGSAELRYRFLRSALLSLFSHLNAMFDILIGSLKSDSEYQNYRTTESNRRANLPDWPRCEHGKFVMIYSDYAKMNLNHELPLIDWSIKPLRNLLAHPSGVRDVTVPDLYDLETHSLTNAANTFQAWIKEACQLCKVTYEMDTESILKQLVATLTDEKANPQII